MPQFAILSLFRPESALPLMSWKHRWAGWNRGLRRYDKGNGSYGYAPPSSFESGWYFLCRWGGLMVMPAGVFGLLLWAIPALRSHVLSFWQDLSLSVR
jgi:hypothetical protein